MARKRIKTLASEWGVPVGAVLSRALRLNLARAHSGQDLLSTEEAERVKSGLLIALDAGPVREPLPTEAFAEDGGRVKRDLYVREYRESQGSKARCNMCLRETNHRILHEVRRNLIAEEPYYRAIVRAEVLQCEGCEEITFRDVREEVAPDFRPLTVESVAYYPPRISRNEPPWLPDLRSQNKVLFSLLREIYDAIYAGARTLGAAGIRTLIDAAMTAKVRDQGNFQRALDAFEKKGFIARKHVEVLKSLIDAGSASAHRAFTPSEEHLETLLDIAENLIENVFIHPVKMKAVSRRVPKRRKRPQLPHRPKSAPL